MSKSSKGHTTANYIVDEEGATLGKLKENKIVLA